MPIAQYYDGCGYTPGVNEVSRGHRCDSGGAASGEAFKRAPQRFVGHGSVLAELDFGLLDIDVRRESRFMNGIAGWREITEIREPQSALVRQLDEPLTGGAAESVRADQFAAIIAVDRGGEHFRRSRCTAIDQQR